MSYQFNDMPDDELVDQYRDMQHLPVDSTKVEVVQGLAYYQGIVREMARRFAIRVENEEVAADEKKSKAGSSSHHGPLHDLSRIDSV